MELGGQHPYVPLASSVVVTNQPAVHNTVVLVPNPPASREWTSGLCSCFNDMEVCCCVLFFAECYECHLARQMDESCCVGCCTPAALIPLRTKLRTQHNIRGTIMEDTIMRCWCYRCAMCQMSREIKYIRRQTLSAQSRAYIVAPS